MSYTISKTATQSTPSTTATGKSSTTNTSSTASSTASLDGDFSTFLKLLTAQIQHQDPTSPMDTTQWTNQLVQYSQVEQQLKSNSYLQTIAGNAGGSMADGVVYIGKTVDASSPTAALSNGQASWNYTLGTTASTATATITDAKGTTVWSGPVSDMSKGTHSFQWNGKETNGKTAPDGDYTLSLTAKTSAGTAVDSAIGVSGVVQSVMDDSGSLVLKIGNTSVPVSSVTAVREN